MGVVARRSVPESGVDVLTKVLDERASAHVLLSGQLDARIEELGKLKAELEILVGAANTLDAANDIKSQAEEKLAKATATETSVNAKLKAREDAVVAAESDITTRLKVIDKAEKESADGIAKATAELNASRKELDKSNIALSESQAKLDADKKQLAADKRDLSKDRKRVNEILASLKQPE